jgi:hypothetical protein
MHSRSQSAVQALDEAITPDPGRYRRDLLITVDCPGASHGLGQHITSNAAPGHGVPYCLGIKRP